jgi:N-acetylmuramoyl-L-alanine amidase
MPKVKHFIPQITTVFLIALLVVAGITRDVVINAKADTDRRPIIILDAGHGGFDGGAVASDGTVEKDINLSISMKLADILRFEGFRVIMTRTEDTGTEDDSAAAIAKRKKSDLENRLKLMSEYPDSVYVSVHLNKFTSSSASGAQVFYTPNFNEAKVLGENIQSAVKNLIQPDNTRVVKRGTSSTYILKKATVPTVIVECGFLSNSGELKLLKTEKYQSKLAFAVSVGIKEYFEDKGE